jgi:hypothetical protein
MLQYSSILTFVLIISLSCVPFVHNSLGFDVRLVAIIVATLSSLLLCLHAWKRHIEQDLRRKIAVDLYEQYWDSTKVQMPPVDVMNSMNIYNGIALRNYWFYRALGVISLASSLFLAVSLGGDKGGLVPVEVTKILAFISSLSTGIIFSFNLVEKGNRARKAFRHLLNAVMLYQHCEIDMKTLLDRYKEAEEYMGDDEFRSSSGSGTSAGNSPS